MPLIATTIQLPLKDLGIVITRPTHQAQHIAERISVAGGRPLLFPTLEILDPPDRQALLSIIDHLDTFDLAIFISPNAVHKAVNLIQVHRTWPKTIRVAAIGRRSAHELERFGIRVDIHPRQRFDSEALLAETELQDMGGKHVVIFRGDGGREVLADTLIQRGAEVVYANAYRRGRPNSGTRDLFYHWSRGEVAAIMMTSTESLHNLYDMVGKLGQLWLRKTPLILGSERITESARKLGISTDLTASSDPGDDSMFIALLKWAESRHDSSGV